jgi:uncharacterized protein YbjT (DUF2867 family)
MPTTNVSRRVLLAGATGLVGSHCLELLLDDPSVESVTALLRRPLPGAGVGARLRAEVVDFDHLDAHADLFAVDQVFSALGTTIGKAGSQAGFRRVDFDAPLAIARLARAHGARHFLLVSALGADPRSRIFYNRVKGELEEAVAALDFRSFTFARPSLLLGDRQDRRLGEEIGKRFELLFPAKFRGVHARQVAAALVRAACDDAPGRRVIENRELRRFPA